MDDMLILYVAMGVFALMLVGLGLTVREFRTKAVPGSDLGRGRSPAVARVGTRKPHLRRVA